MGPPGWTTLILLLGKGIPLSRISATRMTLMPKGRSSIENDATKRTVESHRIAKERVIIGTRNVRI